jgi:hypothetical protein
MTLYAENVNTILAWLYSEGYSVTKLKLLCAYLFLMGDSGQRPTSGEVKTMAPRRYSRVMVGHLIRSIFWEMTQIAANQDMKGGSGCRLPRHVVLYLSQHGTRLKFIIVLIAARQVREEKKGLFFLNTERLAMRFGVSRQAFTEELVRLRRDGILEEYPTGLGIRCWQQKGKLYYFSASEYEDEIREMDYRKVIRLARGKMNVIPVKKDTTLTEESDGKGNQAGWREALGEGGAS